MNTFRIFGLFRVMFLVRTRKQVNHQWPTIAPPPTSPTGPSLMKAPTRRLRPHGTLHWWKNTVRFPRPAKLCLALDETTKREELSMNARRVKHAEPEHAE